MKKQYLFLFSIFIVVFLFLLGLFIYIGTSQQTYVGIGSDYSLKTLYNNKTYHIIFHTTENYYTDAGCLEASGGNINGCNLVVIPNTTIGSCPVNDIKSNGGWFDCSNVNAKDACAYGNSCKNPWTYRCGTRLCSCSNYCKWRTNDYGLRGGISYKSTHGCSWYIDIYDDNNTLVKRISKLQEVSGWDSSKPFTDTVIKDDDFNIDFPTETNQANGNCYYMRGIIRDDIYRTKFCIGNDWIAGDTNHCSDIIEKQECSLRCLDGTVLNETSCSCNSVPIQPKPDNKGTITIGVILFIVIIFIVLTSIIFLLKKRK